MPFQTSHKTLVSYIFREVAAAFVVSTSCVTWLLKLRLICMPLISVTVFSYGYSHTVFGSSDVCLESPQDHILEMH